MLEPVVLGWPLRPSILPASVFAAVDYVEEPQVLCDASEVYGHVCTIAPPQCCLSAFISCCSLLFVVMQCKTNKNCDVWSESKGMHGNIVRYVKVCKATRTASRM